MKAHRKEVKAMKYSKPEIVSAGQALNAIQAQAKGMYSVPDSTGSTTDLRPTNGAYEADE
jgi:hypothetical protein